MTPYYSHGGIQIYHGDCREILPQLPRADLVLTDPPYGIGESSRKQQSRGKLATPTAYGDFDWDRERPADWMFGLMLSKCDKAIIWGGNFFPLMPSSCWLVWDKDNGANDFADCELAWTNLPRAVRRITYRWNGMLQEHAGRDKEPRLHPTQKPLDVIRWAMGHAEPWSSVIDPYMGSGTVLRAAKDADKQATGIDISEEYCEIAAKRLSQEVLAFE